MELGEHIPTSSDESMLGIAVPTSESEDQAPRPPPQKSRVRLGRSTSSSGALPSNRLLDASSTVLDARVLAQHVSGIATSAWQGGFQKAYAKATDVATLEALIAKPCKTCSRGCFQQFRGETSVVLDFRRTFRSMTPLQADLALADMLSTARVGVQPQDMLVDCEEAVLADMLEDSPCSEDERQVPLPAAALRGSSRDCVLPGRILPFPASASRGKRGLVNKGGRPETETQVLLPATVLRGSGGDGVEPGMISSLPAAMLRGKRGRVNKGGRPKKKFETSWLFQGRRVCEPALISLMGIGDKRWQRLKRGLPDARRGTRQKGLDGLPLVGRSNMHLPNICTFLWQLWHSAAEGLPTKMIHRAKRDDKSTSQFRWVGKHIGARNEQIEDVINSESDIEVDEPGNQTDTPQICGATDPDELDLQAVATALHRVIEADNVHAVLRTSLRDLPKRWLPPGKKVWLFWQHVEQCHSHGTPVPSWSTFKHVWKTYFRDKLGFRRITEHAVCTACEGYKKELRHAKVLSLRLQIAAQYTEHLQMQWQDRTVYWKARHMSRLCLTDMLRGGSLASRFIASSLMTVMVDGMDQAKFRIPRDPSQQKTKESERLIRPAIHVTGTLLHGAGLFLTCAEPEVPKDSNQNMECLARGLNDFYRRAGSLPLNLHVQADNTCREGKNQYLALWAAILVSRRIWKSVSLEFMTKGSPF